VKSSFADERVGVEAFEGLEPSGEKPAVAERIETGLIALPPN
jgi:hypothetical protein